MRTMPRLLLLLFCMSVVTMMFIARCGLSMDGQLHGGHQGGLPVSSRDSPGEKALREVMRRKEVEHNRDTSMLQEKVKTLESQLTKVQGQVVNLTGNLKAAEKHLDRYQFEITKNLGRFQSEVTKNSIMVDGLPYSKDGSNKNINVLQNNAANIAQNGIYPQNNGMYLQNNGLDIKFNHDKRRLGYLNDGLNPLPRYPLQNDRSPVFDEDYRRPLYYVNNSLYNPRAEVLEPAMNGAGNEYRLLSQFENGVQRLPGENINFAEQREKTNYRNGMKQTFHDNNMADGAAPSLPSDQIAVREGNFRVIVPPNISLEKGTSDHGETSENKQNSYPAITAGVGDKGNATGNGSEPIDLDKYLTERLQLAEVVSGQQYKTEYELIPFNRFIFNRIFLVDPGLGKRVVEKPIGSKKKDLNEILYHAIETLNKNRSELDQYTYNDFIEGMYRSDPAYGSHYELFFSNKDNRSSRHPRSYVKLSMFRPFAPPMSVQQNVVNTATDWINIILPLSRRLDTFRIFMDQFVTICIKRDKRVYLTVVYFGTDGLQEVKSIMGHVAKTHKFKHMKLVTLNETFTRGRGLQIGALNWKGGGDVLLFFCDVDIVFSLDFLERCRLNSEKGLRVYYPIVFSLYNPKIVYSLQDVPMPSFQDQLVLSKDTGFWRDFGYGMACLYRSDFLKIKGFDEQITGWGGEDVFLYQKFVRSDYFVVRATDPSIFHLWHEKFCDPMLSAEQYRSCIRSKALNEASHAQLGLLAFKDEIDVHRGISEQNRLMKKENT